MQTISRKSTIIAIAALLIVATMGAQPAFAKPVQKKVICYGWGTKDTMYARDNWQEMEKAPLDGAVISVAIDRTKPTTGDGSTANRVDWNLFGPRAFEPEVFESAMADLKVPKWSKFTSNFLIACISSQVQAESFNWFDDKRWKTVMHNWVHYCRLAKESGCKGIILDTEYYGGGNYFDYRDMKQRENVPFDAMSRKVRERGRELMQATAKVFPDMEIPLFLASGYVWYRQMQDPKTPFESNHYALLPSFVDGLLEGADKRTRFIDFSEGAYSATQRQQFLDWYHRGCNKALEYTTVPDLYRAKMSIALPIWLDCSCDYNAGKSYEWNGVDFSKNFYTPQSLKTVLEAALDVTDEYVWIYSEHNVSFFPIRDLPEAYIKAMHEARSSAR